MITVTKRYCVLSTVFYYFWGDQRGHLPPSLYKNGSLMVRMIAPQLMALARAGKAKKCVRLGVEKVCFDRREVLKMFIEAVRCYLIVNNGIGMRTLEEQFVIVQYALERMM